MWNFRWRKNNCNSPNKYIIKDRLITINVIFFSCCYFISLLCPLDWVKIGIIVSQTFVLQVNLNVKQGGKRVEHQGIRIEFVGQIGECVRSCIFITLCCYHFPIFLWCIKSTVMIVAWKLFLCCNIWLHHMAKSFNKACGRHVQSVVSHSRAKPSSSSIYRRWRLMNALCQQSRKILK